MSSYKHSTSVWCKLIWISVNDCIAMCIDCYFVRLSGLEAGDNAEFEGLCWFFSDSNCNIMYHRHLSLNSGSSHEITSWKPVISVMFFRFRVILGFPIFLGYIYLCHLILMRCGGYLVVKSFSL